MYFTWHTAFEYHMISSVVDLKLITHLKENREIYGKNIMIGIVQVDMYVIITIANKMI